MTIEKVQNAEEFICFLEEHKITYKSLKNQLFGDIAIDVIGLLKKDSSLFSTMPKILWWQTQYAINKSLNQ